MKSLKRYMLKAEYEKLLEEIDGEVKIAALNYAVKKGVQKIAISGNTTDKEEKELVKLLTKQRKINRDSQGIMPYMLIANCFRLSDMVEQTIHDSLSKAIGKEVFQNMTIEQLAERYTLRQLEKMKGMQSIYMGVIVDIFKTLGLKYSYR